jgi:hypothetical protein
MIKEKCCHINSGSNRRKVSRQRRDLVQYNHNKHRDDPRKGHLRKKQNSKKEEVTK